MGLFLLSCLISCSFLSHLLLLFHFPISHASSSINMLPLCNHADNSALLQFKNSVTNKTSPRWLCDDDAYSDGTFSPKTYPPKTSSWKDGKNCCQWDGVTCDTMSGHVIGLDLSCGNIRGKLHPNSTLFKLTHLQRLNLAFNDFSASSIYPSFGDLVSLTHLNLSVSSFTGDIPSTISHLSKLVSLDLSDPYYQFDNVRLRLDPSTWSKLILNATHLQEIVLDGVDMSSVREASFSLLMNLSSSLTSLHLWECELRLNLSSDILCLPNLQELYLAVNLDLRGELPKSNWTSPLRLLDLTSTAFSGEVPNSIGHLKSLNYLGLSSCQFYGSVPQSLWNLTQLTYLDLSFNHFFGEISPSLSNLKYLTWLRLDNNNFSGQIPDVFDKVSSLDYLALPSNNQIQGNFPNSIFGLKNLWSLSLSSTNLSGKVDFHQFSKLTLLQYLDLSNNIFLFLDIHSNVSDILPNLRSLSLSSCNLSNFPQFLARSKNLQELVLSNNKIHANIPQWFNDNLLLLWKNIQTVDLSFNKLQGDLPIPPNGIGFFSVSNNNFTGNISVTMCNASSLNYLILSHNNLTGMIPQYLGTFPSLGVLDLQMNNLQGSIPANFSKSNAFETIKLNGNLLEGTLPKSLAHCTKLEVLDVGDNNIEDVFPNWLETLEELKVLVLRANRFHGVITSFGTNHLFPKLIIFDVSKNNFSGPMPTSYLKNFRGMMNVSQYRNGLKYIGNETSYNESVVLTIKGQSMELERILTTYTIIDLSSNKFNGDISEVIGELYGLVGLNLSHNRISGSIPPSLGSLKNLEWLDLSCNQLVGEIPMALTYLNFLSSLNLSQNQLEGMVPIGGQFNTFQNDSYGGNQMLCGFPLSRLCSGGGTHEEGTQSSLQNEEEESERLFGWEAVAVGYACGVVFGTIMGCGFFVTGKPLWLATRLFGMRNRRVRRE